MEALHYLLVLASFLIIIHYQFNLKKRNLKHKNQLPISPPSLPIIGHFHLLSKAPLHETLTTLSNKYGPIFSLRLGKFPAIVLSSRSVIEECFKKNDIIFANRPLFPSRKASTYNFSAFGAPYGDRWRNVRRFSAIEIFSPKSLLSSSDIRTEEVRSMVKRLFRNSSKGAVQKVDVKSLLYLLDFNIMMRMVAGKRCFEEEEVVEIEKAKEKLDYLKQNFSPSITRAVGDHFPFLRWLTRWFGVEKKAKETHKRRDSYLQSLLEQRKHSQVISTNDGHEISRTIVDVMLKLQEFDPEFYTDSVIKGIMQTMLIAGTHTTVITMAAVISRLITNPEVLKHAREEIDILVGQSRLLSDADLSKIPYLHCIITETLRLDMGSLLPARVSSEECNVAGYRIPRGTQLLVNVWAVHRDPQVWTEPNKFIPERFQDCEEEKGACKFLSFGSGRRQCPGASLAIRVMTLTLGTLIQCFDWEKAGDESELSSNGKVKTKPEERSVKIIFRPREALIKVLAEL